MTPAEVREQAANAKTKVQKLATIRAIIEMNADLLGEDRTLLVVTEAPKGWITINWRRGWWMRRQSTAHHYRNADVALAESLAALYRAETFAGLRAGPAA